jgi:membrane protein
VDQKSDSTKHPGKPASPTVIPLVNNSAGGDVVDRPMDGPNHPDGGHGRLQRPQPVRVVRVVLWPAARRVVTHLFRQRVTGLAAEAAFFALLSLPPLLLGLVATLGYFRNLVAEQTITQIRTWIILQADGLFTQPTVQTVIVPAVDEVLRGGRADIVSIGFLLSLWSGSRALNVYIDTITIAYGQAGVRGIVRTRLLSLALYLAGLCVGAVTIPLVVAAPTVLRHAAPGSDTYVEVLYWPAVTLLSIAFFATLYHLSIPQRTRWVGQLPGAAAAMVVWILGGLILRLYLQASLPGIDTYGSLAAPIAILAWLFITSLAVLIGSALNAEMDATIRSRRLAADEPRSGSARLAPGPSAPHDA